MALPSSVSAGGKKMHSREDKSLYFDMRAFANIQAAEAVKIRGV
ncbi:hypothetical protein ACP0HM_30145 [Escherichia coli]